MAGLQLLTALAESRHRTATMRVCPSWDLLQLVVA